MNHGHIIVFTSFDQIIIIGQPYLKINWPHKRIGLSEGQWLESYRLHRSVVAFRTRNFASRRLSLPRYVIGVSFVMEHFSQSEGRNDTFTCSYSYIYIHYYRVYDELTTHHLSMWLGSSVDRALHRYRKVMGLNPVQAFKFRLLFQLLKLIKHCQDPNVTQERCYKLLLAVETKLASGGVGLL